MRLKHLQRRSDTGEILMPNGNTRQRQLGSVWAGRTLEHEASIRQLGLHGNGNVFTRVSSRTSGRIAAASCVVCSHAVRAGIGRVGASHFRDARCEYPRRCRQAFA